MASMDILSPTSKVARQLQVIAFSHFQIDFRYWHQSDKSDIKSVNPLFPRRHQMPFSKEVVINCQSLPMIAAFDYMNNNKEVITFVEYKIYSNKSIQIGKNPLKVCVRLDPNGMVVIHSVSVVVDEGSHTTKKDSDESQVEDIEMNNKQNNSTQMETEETAGADTNNSTNDKDSGDQKEEKNKNPKSVTIDLQVEPLWMRGKLTDNEIQNYRHIEDNLILADKNWKGKTNAKDSLEEYIYEWMDELKGGGYDPFVETNDKEVFLKELNCCKQWLYEQEVKGVVHSETVYEERLNKMKEMFSNGIVYRKREFETSSSLREQLGKDLQQMDKDLQQLVKDLQQSDKDGQQLRQLLETEINDGLIFLDQSLESYHHMRAILVDTSDVIQRQINSIDVSVTRMSDDRTRLQGEKRRLTEEAKQSPPPPAAAPQQQQNSAEQNNKKTRT